jgi:hypothetical protein
MSPHEQRGTCDPESDWDRGRAAADQKEAGEKRGGKK